MTAAASNRPKIDVLLCQPRGFCAGVDRAIKIVNNALLRYGAPVYVRHEIVHNREVVSDLTARGAVFVEQLDEIPHTDAPVVFSAHGVAPSVVDEATRRNMFVLDAVCPLVSKVHLEARRYHKQGYHLVLIGHAGHPEVEGTLGQVPAESITLIENCEQLREFTPPEGAKIAFLTQTTLSVDDTKEIVAELSMMFPDLHGPGREDICYATTNRQAVVKQIAQGCDYFLIIGSPTSSNSQRLVEVAKRAGCDNSRLIDCDLDVDFCAFADGDRIGISAGASAPEVLVQRVIEGFRNFYSVSVTLVGDIQENVTFKLPNEVRMNALPS